MQRDTYNGHINRVPGLYNETSKVEVVAEPVQSYDFLNLNEKLRTHYLNEHFNITRDRFLKQLNISQFDEFGLPVHDEVQKICGRVINTNTEDDKLKLDSIGLFNVGEDSGNRTYKLKLNMSEC